MSMEDSPPIYVYTWSCFHILYKGREMVVYGDRSF
jgi:hypothetical protein